MAAIALLIAPTTPPDYHRIVSRTLSIPSESHISVPVGLLACQRTVLSLFVLDTHRLVYTRRSTAEDIRNYCRQRRRIPCPCIYD